MEVKCEAKSYMVIMKCDKCGTGKMERNGNTVLTSNPPLYPHKCDVCGHDESYPVAYPFQSVEYYIPS